MLLLKRIKDNFPNLRWESFRYIDEGWDHEVIILDNEIVFRFPDDKEYQQLLPTETRVLKTLEPLIQVRIPQYQYIAADFSFGGYPIINGQTLSKQLFNNLTASDKAAIIAQLAEFLSTIHRLKEQGHDFSAVRPFTLYQDQEELKLAATKYLVKALSRSDYEFVQRILADIDDILLHQYPTVFLHGDIYYRHLLWDTAQKQLGIIDFSDMNLGDPAYDFAELSEYGKDFVKKVYKLYSGPKDATFLERAWKYQCWVAVYMMADFFNYRKTNFAEARETFDRVKDQNKLMLG